MTFSVALAKLPLVAQLKGYRLRWLGHDAVAGLSVAAVSLPAAIAYPAIAGLPIQMGFFAAIFAMLGYALIGPSRQLMVGPDTGTCIMLASVIAGLNIADGGDRVVAAQHLAILVGVLCFVGGLLRFGLLANFLSRPMLVGFLTGISISLIIGQITRLTAVPIHSSGLVRPIAEFIAHSGDIHTPTLLVGAASFLTIRLIQRLLPWSPAPLIVVIAAVAASAGLSLEQHGVAVVGTLPALSFAIAVPPIPTEHFADLLGGALAIMLVGFGSGVVTARSFAMKAHRDVDANRELLGFGGANLASGFFGGFPVSAADSRTAVNFAVGGRTQLTALVAAGGLAGAVLLVSDLLAILPNATLGAILVSAAIDLVDIHGLRAIKRISRVELAFSIVTILGVIIIGVLQGVFLAIAVTLAQLLLTASQPRIALLGRLPAAGALVKLHRHPNATPVPGMTIVMIQSAIVFFNADYLKHRLLKIARARALSSHHLVLDASAVNILDSTGIAKLEELQAELKEIGITLWISELNYRARKVLLRSSIAQNLGEDALFATTEAAVAALLTLDQDREVPPALSGRNLKRS
jgi:high affinity sulfate transporter 1